MKKMNNKFIICIVGKTSSGKDTISRYIQKNYGISPVVSYTTRPMRRNETEGKEHYFITPEEAKEKLNSEQVLAYTKFNDTEYFATVEAMHDNVMSYIIDPKGIEFLRETGIPFKSIYVECPERILIDRAVGRGDSLNDVLKRLENERDQFDAFADGGLYDYIVHNGCDESETQPDLSKLFSSVDEIMRNMDFIKA